MTNFNWQFVVSFPVLSVECRTKITTTGKARVMFEGASGMYKLSGDNAVHTAKQESNAFK